MKELLFDCGTNLTPKRAAQQPGRQGVDPDLFNPLRRQKRPGTKHPFGHEDPWRVCKVGRLPIMRPAARFPVVSVRDLSFMFLFSFSALLPEDQTCQCVTLPYI